MPTYLIHGFRWHRLSIRIHIILNDLEDCATEWIMAPATQTTLLESFYEFFDFIPSCAAPSPPTPTLPPVPDIPVAAVFEGKRDGTTKENGNEKDKNKDKDPTLIMKKRSFASLRNLARKQKSSSGLAVEKTGTWNGGTVTKIKVSGINGTGTSNSNNCDGAGARNGHGNQRTVEIDSTRPVTNATARPTTSKGGSSADSIDVFQYRPSSTSSTRSSRLEAAAKGDNGPAFNEWSVVKLLEQYDPDSTECCTQPFAYVADYMVPIGLSVCLAEEMKRYEELRRAGEQQQQEKEGKEKEEDDDENNDAQHNDGSEKGEHRDNHKNDSPGPIPTTTRHRPRQLPTAHLHENKDDEKAYWFERLRNSLQQNEEMGWYIVYCGDEERSISGQVKENILDKDDSQNLDAPIPTPRSAGLRGFFKGKRSLVEG